MKLKPPTSREKKFRIWGGKSRNNNCEYTMMMMMMMTKAMTGDVQWLSGTEKLHNIVSGRKTQSDNIQYAID